ncbi:MAG: YdeI/OmpD-associated family protein [Dyella sp.]|uniref:YdeI/OmpD-associated family protein n=1 Tax=Dyella sp. TaxID=1869338 RepID=UPI003F7F9974
MCSSGLRGVSGPLDHTLRPRRPLKNWVGSIPGQSAAYDSSSKAVVPSDFQSALDGNARAKVFFETLDSRNRYAVLYRIQTAKNVETRSRRISQFVLMLARHEKIHP